ncbi:Bifunctional purine biosynthetic protein ade1 [Agyrium rufum]|nr:Bifunctional purine biosynthetic protein ade1 [Agyrium rufum]
MAGSSKLPKLPLALVASGKVREIYEIDSATLLFVATDRISAYDVIMKNNIPEKGALLTSISDFWFNFLGTQHPDERTHFVQYGLPKNLHDFEDSYGRRSMQVTNLRMLPIEAIVRGYLTGSAWKEYQAKGTVHGIELPAGLQESQEIPGGPLYTPSTKAEAGKNDENIHPREAVKIIAAAFGEEHAEHYADSIESLATRFYEDARDHASENGIIIADTKFEFGISDKEPEMVYLGDEVLTPDSSRFWPKATYKVGQSQDSYDKQYLRDWLVENGLKGVEGVTIPDKVAQKTRDKYVEAYEALTGEKWKGGGAWGQTQ